MGLQLLSLLLHKHYDKECVIIIDEYDTPIQQDHLCEFYNEIVDFIRNFFGWSKRQSTFGFWIFNRYSKSRKKKVFLVG